MSYKLEKPYKTKDRVDFIIKYNHSMGLLIEETDKALYALENNEIMKNGKVIVDVDYEKKQQNIILQNKINEIQTKLNELDQKRIRAICENSVKDEKSGQTWLDYYNKFALDYRKQLVELKSKIIEI